MRFHQEVLVSSSLVKWPGSQAKKAFLSHFRRGTQLETLPTNRAGHGHLDLPRCLGFFLFQGREGLYTQCTAPSHLTLYHKQSQGLPLGPFSLTLGQGFSLHQLHVGVSPSTPAGEEASLASQGQAAAWHQVFFPFFALASALTPSESSQLAHFLSFEKLDCWTGFWFHSPGACFPHYNSLISDSLWIYECVLPSSISVNSVHFCEFCAFLSSAGLRSQQPHPCPAPWRVARSVRSSCL